MLKTAFVPMESPDIQADIPTVFARDYSVAIDGMPCQVRLCRESALPFNRIWPGYQRQIDQTELAGFVSFSSDKAVKVCVENKKPTGSAPVVVRPLSRNVSPSVEGGKIEFTLTEPGQYVLENGSSHSPLYLFFDPPRHDDGANAKWHFGPGVHFPGTILLSSGDSVYIDPDAIVFGSIYGIDVHRARIFGGGTLHGGTIARFFRSFSENYQNSTIKFYNSTDIRMEDIIVQDAPGWVVSFWNCSNVAIDRVKTVGQWRYNTDGIDICNSDNVKITNSFVRSFDDSIVLKGMDHIDYRTVKWRKNHTMADIEVKGCVLWCGWGRTLEVGIETADVETGVTEKLKVRIANLSDDATVANLTIRNLTINGRHVISPDGVLYETEGRVGDVRWE